MLTTLSADNACDDLGYSNPAYVDTTVTAFGNVSPQRANDLAQARSHHGCAVGYAAGYNTALDQGKQAIEKQVKTDNENLERQITQVANQKAQQASTQLPITFTVGIGCGFILGCAVVLIIIAITNAFKSSKSQSAHV